jgi:monofunctional chorismate mutase
MSFVGMIRGAAPVAGNEAAEIERATRELCAALLDENSLGPADVISAIVTVSPALTAALPTDGARKAGWGGVPLFSARARAGAAPGIVEVEAHVRLRRDRRLRPVLLGDAAARRPDLAVIAAAARRPRRAAPGACP